MLVFKPERLRQLRVKGGFDMSKFARALQKYAPKAYRSTIRNWEKGAIPNSLYGVAISKILGIALESLFDFIEDHPPIKKRKYTKKK